jgi:hypothetical protein
MIYFSFISYFMRGSKVFKHKQRYPFPCKTRHALYNVSSNYTELTEARLVLRLLHHEQRMVRKSKASLQPLSELQHTPMLDINPYLLVYLFALKAKVDFHAVTIYRYWRCQYIWKIVKCLYIPGTSPWRLEDWRCTFYLHIIQYTTKSTQSFRNLKFIAFPSATRGRLKNRSLWRTSTCAQARNFLQPSPYSNHPNQRLKARPLEVDWVQRRCELLAAKYLA